MSVKLGKQVSFDDEDLILVDAEDQITGYDSKVNAHRGEGKLHRAFSIFLFTPSGRVLLQQRSAEKPLWPGFWSNSCCSHPRRGESYQVATHRRLLEELGASAKLTWLYQFQYAAAYGEAGSERELCAVLAGCVPEDAEISVNDSEVDEWGWFSPSEVDARIEQEHARFTPWFLLEWQQLRTRYHETIQRLCMSPHSAVA